MNQANNQGEVIGYFRKSQADKERQVLSIPSQISWAQETAKRMGLKINHLLQEEKSAKIPYIRPHFDDMVRKIKSSLAKVIICWKLDRLARNPEEAGIILGMLKRGEIQRIITSEKEYWPGDNALISYVEFGMADQYVRDLSKNVKRGLRAKYAMGYPPCLSKIGYKNEGLKKGEKYLVPDPDRFELAKQVLELFLKKNMSVSALVRYADEVLGLRTMQRSREGGNPMTGSGMHTFLRDPIHAGFFYAKNENGETVRYELNASVPRMITEAQYWEIQQRLGKKGMPRPSTYKNDFVYKDHSSCGCAGFITAEHQYQLICSKCKKKFAYRHKTHCPGCNTKIENMENPTYLHYIRYHCTKNKNENCAEPSMQEFQIDEAAASYFENNLQISPDLRDWCLEHFDELAESDGQNELEVIASWEKNLQAKRKQHDELIMLRAKGTITDEDLQRLDTPVQEEIKKAEAMLKSMRSEEKKKNLEQAKKNFDLAVGIANIFRNGTFDEKKEALNETGSNLTIKAKNTTIYPKEELKIIMNGLLAAKKENPAFEPKNYTHNTNKTGDFSPVLNNHDTMLRR